MIHEEKAHVHKAEDGVSISLRICSYCPLARRRRRFMLKKRCEDFEKLIVFPSESLSEMQLS